jgi:CBS domain-containing protein
MSVGRICTREVYTAKAGETLTGAARRMRDRRVGTLVVVDEQSRPMGLITDRDIAMRVVAVGGDIAGARVRDVMTPMPTVVLEDTSIESALAEMRTGRMRRLVVVNGAGTLVGVITLDDILSLIAEEFSLVGRLLEREAPLSASQL